MATEKTEADKALDAANWAEYLGNQKAAEVLMELHRAKLAEEAAVDKLKADEEAKKKIEDDKKKTEEKSK